MNAAECAVMYDREKIVINMYHEYEAEFSINKTSVKIRTSGDYIADSSAKIQMTFSNPSLEILLRIPSWSRTSKVTVKGKEYPAQTGYFKVPIITQQMEIVVQFDNTAYIKSFQKTVLQHKSSDWQYQRWGSPENFGEELGRTFLCQSRCTIQKGAVLLCRSKLIGNTSEEMFDHPDLIDRNYQCELEKYQTDADVMAAYRAHLSNGKHDFFTKVCDYASAANIIQEDREYFSIYF